MTDIPYHDIYKKKLTTDLMLFYQNGEDIMNKLNFMTTFIEIQVFKMKHRAY